MTQSTDTQQGLDYMIQLRDKLCKNSIEAAAMNKAIERYQSEMAMVELRNNLVYKAPRGFNNMYIEELQTVHDEVKYRNRLVYLVFGIYALFCLWALFGTMP